MTRSNPKIIDLQARKHLPKPHWTAEDRKAQQKRRKWRGPRPRPHVLRAAELNRHFTHRYGEIIPGTVDDVEVMLHVLALNNNPRSRIENWLSWRAPWFDDSDMVDEIIARPIWMKPARIGKKITLTLAIADMLRIRTIRPCDKTRKELDLIRKQRKVARQKARRREKGKVEREEWERFTISKQAPWVTLGMSRAKWYRTRRFPEHSDNRETGVKAHNSISLCEASHLSHAQVQPEQTVALIIRSSA